MRAKQFLHKLKEAAGDGDVANAVVAEVIKLIGEGHTEVSPDVITTKVSAALGRPFMLKDLVAANNSSPELQHYIDTINPSKIKFSTDILTVKNEDPMKEKQAAQDGVAKMASRAASRPRLGEGQNFSKDKITKFHKKLDTLVHDTFGKRKDEVEEESSSIKGPHGYMDVERKNGVTTVKRREWDSSSDKRTNVKGGTWFPKSNRHGEGTGTSVKTGSGVGSNFGTRRKFPAIEPDDYTEREDDIYENYRNYYGYDRVNLPDEPSLYWNNTGRLSNEYNELYNKLVPSSGKADTVEGEVLRAASKIYYRHYNDGDSFNQASFDQLEPYIGTVKSYDDLAEKATEFALKANGQYTPNPDWDSLDAMEYGPEDEGDDWDDEDDYEDDSSWEDDDDLAEAKGTNGDVVVTYVDRNYKTIKKTFKNDPQGAPENAVKRARAYAAKLEKSDNVRGKVRVDWVVAVDEGSKSNVTSAKTSGINWPKEVPSDRELERAANRDEEENDPHPYVDPDELKEGDMTNRYRGFKIHNRVTNQEKVYPYIKGKDSRDVEDAAIREQMKLTGQKRADFSISGLVKINEEYEDEYEDDYEEEDQGFFVAISSEEDGVFIGMLVKEDGKWRERRYKGNAPYNWGGSYMGYLTPQDVMSWINKDYGRNYQVEGPMDENEANEYLDYMSEGTNLNEMHTHYDQVKYNGKLLTLDRWPDGHLTISAGTKVLKSGPFAQIKAVWDKLKGEQVTEGSSQEGVMFSSPEGRAKLYNRYKKYKGQDIATTSQNLVDNAGKFFPNVHSLAHLLHSYDEQVTESVTTATFKNDDGTYGWEVKRDGKVVAKSKTGEKTRARANKLASQKKQELKEGWFSKDKPTVEPTKANVGDVVTITKTHPQLDIIPGDQYSVNTSDDEGVTINHGFGTRFRDVKVPHSSYKVRNVVEEGWESGPEERAPRERDPDWEYDQRRQEKLDRAADAEPKKTTYKLLGRGPKGEPNYDFGLGEFDSQEEAIAARDRLMADPDTPNPRNIGIQTIRRSVAEGVDIIRKLAGLK